jgi:hypothetical protein
MKDNLLIPLSHLALDAGATADELARRYADVVLTDDLGRVCIDREIARELIAVHQARVAAQAAAERERAERDRANIAGQLGPLRARVQALKARAEKMHRVGHSDMSAYEMMCANDEQDRLDGTPSYKMDNLMAGRSYGGRFTPTPTQE